MAAVRRAISCAAAAGRSGLATLSRQDALYPPMATVRRTFSSPIAAGKLNLGAWGLQVRSCSTGPEWMSEHYQQVSVDPEFAFRNLRAGDKDFAVLVQLMVGDQIRRVINSHEEGKDAVLLQVSRLYDKQLDFENGLWALVVVLGGGLGCLAYCAKEVKDQSIELLESLASNSGAIVSALVSAAKHGADSWILGKGELFKWDRDWEKKKKEEEKIEDSKTEMKKAKEAKSSGKKYKSRWFSNQDDE